MAHRDAVGDRDRAELHRVAAGRVHALLGRLASRSSERLQGVISFQRRRDADLRLGEVVVAHADGAQHPARGGPLEAVGDLAGAGLEVGAASGGLRHRGPPGVRVGDSLPLPAARSEGRRGRGGRALAPDEVPTRDGERADSRGEPADAKCRLAHETCDCGPAREPPDRLVAPGRRRAVSPWRPPRRGAPAGANPRSRRMFALRPLSVVAPRSERRTSSAACSGTSTSECRSWIWMAPMSRPVRPGLVGQRADDVLRAHAAGAAGVDEQARRARLRRPGARARRRARAGARVASRPPARRGDHRDVVGVVRRTGDLLGQPDGGRGDVHRVELGGELEDHRADGVEGPRPARRRPRRAAGPRSASRVRASRAARRSAAVGTGAIVDGLAGQPLDRRSM